MNLKKSILVTSCLLAFILGIFLGPYNFNLAYLLFFSTVLGGLLLIWGATNPGARCSAPLQRKILPIVFILTFLALGYVRYQTHILKVNENVLSFYNEQGAFRMVGKVCTEPDRRPHKTNLTVCVAELDSKKVAGKLLVSKEKYPAFKYGEKLEVYGRLLTPTEFDTFSYKNYLARYDIYSVVYNPKITKLDEANRLSFFYWIFELKEAYENLINKIWHEPQASFLAGLLLGSRRGIPEDLMEDFNTTGLTHIIAISGYNITLIIVILATVFKSLPRKLKFILTTLSIIAFTILVGASAAVVRASIMGILSLIALQSGRQAQVTIILLLSAALMLLKNPFILRFDVGFQLSFLATLGLVYVSPYFEKLLKLLPNTLAIRESLSLTLSAQVTAVPIILSSFGRLSLVAPLANLLVAPAIPASMLFGFLASASYLVSSALGQLLSYIAWLSLEYIIQVTKLCARIPSASVELREIGKEWLVGYYILLTALLACLHFRK